VKEVAMLTKPIHYHLFWERVYVMGGGWMEFFDVCVFFFKMVPSSSSNPNNDSKNNQKKKIYVKDFFDRYHILLRTILLLLVEFPLFRREQPERPIIHIMTMRKWWIL
jgi:hypothetical protein